MEPLTAERGSTRGATAVRKLYNHMLFFVSLCSIFVYHSEFSLALISSTQLARMDRGAWYISPASNEEEKSCVRAMEEPLVVLANCCCQHTVVLQARGTSCERRSGRRS